MSTHDKLTSWLRDYEFSEEDVPFSPERRAEILARLERLLELDTWHPFTDSYSSWPQRDKPVWVTDGKYIAIGGRAANGALVLKQFLGGGVFAPERATHWTEIVLPNNFPVVQP